jgi:two-component system sensor histidine kinase KdpD
VQARSLEQERAAAARVAETEREKSEFLALVSHELRTPLTAVKGFVDTVLLHWDRLLEEQRRELLARASTNAEELSRLVGQLLDFARLDAARVRVSPQRLVVADAIDAVLRDVAPVLMGHDVSVVVPDDLCMTADPEAFAHVLVNILTNAAKFSDPGSPIVVHAEPEDDKVIVSVTDRGIGIAPDEQQVIFERFYQSPDNTLSRRGTGIGLTIAKRFAEVQGGRIMVASQPGTGSTFAFTVPAAGDDESEVGT